MLKFGLIKGYDAWGKGEKNLGLFISDNAGRDDLRTDNLPYKPSWFTMSEDCECTWEIPPHITEAQVIEDLTTLGYIHDLDWDEDYS